MNIHKYEKQIQALLLERTRISENTGKKSPQHLPGIYLISRTLDDRLIKLVESSNLFTRIRQQYKMCYPLRSEHFFLRYIVICPREKDGKESYAQKMEKQFRKVIDSEVYDSYSKEYLSNPGVSEMEKRMYAVLKSRYKYFTIALKFTPAGFRLFDGSTFKNLQSFETLPNLNPADSLLSLLKSQPRPKPVKKKKPMIKYNMRRFSDMK